MGPRRYGPAAQAAKTPRRLRLGRLRWTPDFGRPDKVEPPGLEAPYQEYDDAGQATCVWGSV